MAERSRPPRTQPTGARFFTLASARWMVRHRAITPWYLIRYWRFFRFKLANPEVVTRGMIFMDKGADISMRSGFARLTLGRWIHIGAHTAIRAHEGTMTIGDKCVFGRGDSLNCYLDVELGDSVLIADDVYISDFDHKFTDLTVPIKDQGIAKSRVRIETDVWLATKVTVARGVVIGTGSVVGANAVVSRDLPPFSVAVGAPARVIRDRRKLR
ncbi:acetyltransferase-like isoleucine patch superfamily enzyme [Jatrophihabitans sp. GAS493]|uniref:acyltransferase n=1 Tax=Jatrophihabitans sp. GAS493 TaxID=1907575 RepID=UPI000BC01A4D|nr:acyltransferase [Jatrophihabitans sp. GAS493]SOD73358.1 acetyltransferase-like isoleucine patch superfamily enzyme [Jatrophihabitans sp. GAS493]